MLSILLINDNKIVSRLFQLSSQKHGYELEESREYAHKNSAYNILFIDSKSYDEGSFKALQDEVTFDKTAYLCERGEEKPQAFDLMLEKPFLPTDFVNLMNENFRVVDPSQAEVDLPQQDSESLDELDLDSLEEIKLDDDLEESIDEVEDISEPKKSAQDEISGALMEIDELDEIKESSLEDDEVIQESIKEEAGKEDVIEDSLKSVAAASAAVAAANATSTSIDDDKLKILDELDGLDENDLKRALSEEVTDEIEDNLSSNSLQEERVVEPSDLEEIINKAVTKALQNMDIIVSFKPKES